MMPMLISIKPTAPGNGAREVPRTRSTDALGACLRDAFGSAALPVDMATLLSRLDRTPS